MKAYSLDLRERVMAAYEQGQRSIAEVAQQFQVGQTFVKRCLARSESEALLLRWRTVEAVSPC
jgi:transposase